MEDAQHGRVGSVLLDFDLACELDDLEPGDRFRASGHCPSHDDTNPSLIVTVRDDGKILHNCLAGCGQEQVREAIGQQWSRWFPNRRSSRRWKSKRPPALLHQLAIQAQHRELLRRGEEMTTLLSSGITLDAIKALRVGFTQLDPKSWPLDVKSLDRLVFFLQDDGYIGRQLYSLALAKGTHRRKLTHGRGGLTMRRGGPAAGPIVVVEGCMSALAGFSMRCECIGVPGIRWSFDERHRVLFDQAEIVVVIGDSGDGGMRAAAGWARSIRRWVDDVRLLDLERVDGFDLADLVAELGPNDANVHMEQLLTASTPLPPLRPGPPPATRAHAADVLRRELADGPVPVKDIEAMGISGRTLERARVDVGTHAHRVDDERGHRWVVTIADSCAICQQKTSASTHLLLRRELGGLGGHDESPANAPRNHVRQVSPEGAQIIDFPGARHAS